ncbi:putative intracellular protease/amidase [Acinetobacter calcoaceticus]|uniref:Putative intracellular protease/amidase n=1 Tax=Acinetobacter calcoaceticus TaxID=471 RepID=A0A4V2R1I8_ACICA|nr:putative intracellular protease/amidase [Acinetobacter calcoaceticus]
MKQETIHLAIYDSMADWEVGYVVAHINSPEFQKVSGRFEVKTVGLNLEPIRSKGGLRILPDLTLDMLQSEHSSMLILPGADSAAQGGIDAFVQKAADFLDADVPVAAICGATAALAKFGLLDHVAHTSNIKMFLEMTGYQGAAHYQEQLAVTAGNLITASGTAPIEFAIEIFRKLDLYSETTLKAWYKLYKDQKAEGFFELMAAHEDAH